MLSICLPRCHLQKCCQPAPTALATHELVQASDTIGANVSGRECASTQNYRNPRMLTGELRSQIDAIWNAFWTGGISNPLEVMEQITYLLFLKRLDDLQTLEENKAARLGRPIERRIFPEGNDPRGKPYAQLRWSRFKHA